MEFLAEFLVHEVTSTIKYIAKPALAIRLMDFPTLIIESNNESLKDKKIRELAAKVKNIQLAYEKEKLTYRFFFAYSQTHENRKPVIVGYEGN